MKKKVIALVAALALVLCVAVAGTFAWLQDQTEEVVNTFTYGDINIDLKETTGDEYQMVPGNTIVKDPKVTVEAGSEECYLFVEITKSDNYGTYLADYEVADGWTALDGNNGVYYREVSVEDINNGASYSVLKDDQVTVNTSVTKTDMETIKDANQPTLTFKAYAVQKANVADAADAWNIAKGEKTN